jgi:hypothetical protein
MAWVEVIDPAVDVPATALVHEARSPDRSPVARAALARIAERARPVALARQRALPVLSALAELLPEGLRRGTTISVESGPGATSLALALVAGASADGSWVAAVGVPSLGLMAVAELGVAPERLLVIDAGSGGGGPVAGGPVAGGPVAGGSRPAVRTATVVAALVDAVDIVLLGARVSAADARRLTARAREQGAVVVALPGRWPVVADLRIRVSETTWELPHRRLAARRVEVTVDGRGAAALARRANLWLPGVDGTVSTDELGADLAADRRYPHRVHGRDRGRGTG